MVRHGCQGGLGSGLCSLEELRPCPLLYDQFLGPLSAGFPPHTQRLPLSVAGSSSFPRLGISGHCLLPLPAACPYPALMGNGVQECRKDLGRRWALWVAPGTALGSRSLCRERRPVDTREGEAGAHICLEGICK